ncbi:uncharacterized protein BCR38DRAFT_434699 [Pseudomassariella vexata]|uniref:F-box domain-containing protein n=1 Tax=Pseudomassariella vexata TaxID=1141098 RepID=A0A1Y2DYK9_9PEZI|nr:uncharacterized protein BCR38DRAFT_434699 [Pseudomassariella vexata]ORY64299.1 hypothetical protein BCR38DRAFT_434699 [Pseudomassariella vexata]
MLKSFFKHLRRPTSTRPPTSTKVATGWATSLAADMVSHLPLELHMMLLEYLEPDDVTAGLNVCHSWRHIWLSDQIWPGLASRWFPGLSDHIRTTSGGKGMGEHFRRHLHNYCWRVAGRFASALHHGMLLQDDRFFELSKGVPAVQGGIHSYQGPLDLGPDEGFPRFMMYNHERIAWWPEAYGLPYFAVVDNLRTRERRAYVFPDNQGEKLGYKTAMSDKLLLMGRDRLLHAWHFEQDRLQSVEIPETFKRCVVEGDNVLLVSIYANIYLWRFGHPLRHVDMHDFPCYIPGPVIIADVPQFPPSTNHVGAHRVALRLEESGLLLDFFIHPTAPDVFFVVTYRKQQIIYHSDGHFTVREAQLVVHEYAHDRVIASYSLGKSADLGNHVLSGRTLGNRDHLRWEKCDSFGGYSLLAAYGTCRSWPVGDPLDSDGSLDRTEFSETDTMPPTAHLSVCFNIYTKSFNILCHHRQDNIGAIAAYHVWNGRLATSYVNGVSRTIVSVNDCVDSRHHPTPDRIPPRYTTTTRHGDHHIITRRHRNIDRELTSTTCSLQTRKLLSTVDFELDASRRYASQRQSISPQPHGVQRLLGDDDFLVYVDDQAYTVWSFSNKMTTQLRRR